MAYYGGLMSYDIIGDIHGHALTLRALLEKLDYSLIDGCYQHPQRKVIFLGDFIDRGPTQRDTLEIVRPMVETGAALAVMGNHEFNAVAFATESGSGDHLRPRNQKNREQHAAFLREYPADSPDYQDVIAWFETLPMWLDLGELRVIHACWDQKLMTRIGQAFDGARLTRNLLKQASTRERWEYEAVETLLKGKEIPLPHGHHFHDSYGIKRRYIRTRWWSRTERTYRGIFFGSPEWASQIPDDEVQGDHAIDYDHREPPVFLGHYWLDGAPAPLESNVACLDYSVARPGGKLVAYRWNGEKALRTEAFVSLDRLED
jgi:calcineurin-like phosphoesterase family protein